MFSSFGSGFEQYDPVYFEDVEAKLRQFEWRIGSTILVYGSVARFGCGHDLDVIIVGTEEMWKEFKELVLEEVEEVGRLGAWIRQSVVHSMLGHAFTTLKDESLALIDVYIFPPDWEKRLDELQRAFPHEDPNFMMNICRDTKTLGQCSIEAARMSC